MELADMLMMLLIYYRSYITQEFLGYLFGIDDSRICRLIKKLSLCLLVLWLSVKTAISVRKR
jgi:hypothetical protein